MYTTMTALIATQHRKELLDWAARERRARAARAARRLGDERAPQIPPGRRAGHPKWRLLSLRGWQGARRL